MNALHDILYSVELAALAALLITISLVCVEAASGEGPRMRRGRRS